VVGVAGHVAPHLAERVTDHEIAKINAQLDELAVKAPNPLLGAFSDDDSDAELDEDTELTQSLREFTVTDDGKKIDMRSTRSRARALFGSAGAVLTLRGRSPTLGGGPGLPRPSALAPRALQDVAAAEEGGDKSGDCTGACQCDGVGRDPGALTADPVRGPVRILASYSEPEPVQ